MDKKLYLSIFFTSLCIHTGICQTSTNSLLAWLDATVGKENLSINNGYIANEQYIISNNSNLYLKNADFVLGSVLYEEQLYNDLYINYDSYTDNVLLKPNGIEDFKSVVVKREFTSSFTFLGKKFINLNYEKQTGESFLNGYFEEIPISENLTLYTKHGKTRTEKIDNLRVVSEFYEYKQFVLFSKGNLYKYSQSNIERLFPDQKKQISSFYADNSKLQKSNEQLFIENLLKYINTSSK